MKTKAFNQVCRAQFQEADTEALRVIIFIHAGKHILKALAFCKNRGEKDVTVEELSSGY